MTTHSKGIFGSVAATIVVVVAYLCSYSYFGGHHSQFYFASGESIFLVPDTALNRFFAVFYAPISYGTQTPIRFEPKSTPPPRPNHALQRTEAGVQPSPIGQP